MPDTEYSGHFLVLGLDGVLHCFSRDGASVWHVPLRVSRGKEDRSSALIACSSSQAAAAVMGGSSLPTNSSTSTAQVPSPLLVPEDLQLPQYDPSAAGQDVVRCPFCMSNTSSFASNSAMLAASSDGKGIPFLPSCWTAVLKLDSNGTSGSNVSAESGGARPDWYWRSDAEKWLTLEEAKAEWNSRACKEHRVVVLRRTDERYVEVDVQTGEHHVINEDECSSPETPLTAHRTVNGMESNGPLSDLLLSLHVTSHVTRLFHTFTSMARLRQPVNKKTQFIHLIDRVVEFRLLDMSEEEETGEMGNGAAAAPDSPSSSSTTSSDDDIDPEVLRRIRGLPPLEKKPDIDIRQSELLCYANGGVVLKIGGGESAGEAKNLGIIGPVVGAYALYRESGEKKKGHSSSALFPLSIRTTTTAEDGDDVDGTGFPVFGDRFRGIISVNEMDSISFPTNSESQPSILVRGPTTPTTGEDADTTSSSSEDEHDHAEEQDSSSSSSETECSTSSSVIELMSDGALHGNSVTSPNAIAKTRRQSTHSNPLRYSAAARRHSGGASSATIVTPQSPLQKTSSFFDDNFDAVGLLGKGSSGAAILARHRVTEVFYAVKVVISYDYETEKDVLQEVRLHALLDSKHLVRYHACWSEIVTERRAYELATTGVFKSVQHSHPLSTSHRNLLTLSPNRRGRSSSGGGSGSVFSPSKRGARNSNGWGADLNKNPVSMLGDESFGPGAKNPYVESVTSPSSRRRGAAAHSDPFDDYFNDRRRYSDQTYDDEEEETDYSDEEGSDQGGIDPRSLVGARVVFLQMELCQMTLANYLSARKEIDRMTNLVVILQVLSGLRYLHRRGILHRDIKTTNVFMDFRCQYQAIDDSTDEDSDTNNAGGDCYDAIYARNGATWEDDALDCSCTALMTRPTQQPSAFFNNQLESQFPSSPMKNREATIQELRDAANVLLDTSHRDSRCFLEDQMAVLASHSRETRHSYNVQQPASVCEEEIIFPASPATSTAQASPTMKPSTPLPRDRDVKRLARRMLNKLVQAKLGDFGLAKNLHNQRPEVAGFLSRHEVNTVGVGSPLYSSPEQQKGDVCTVASDGFSLGVVIAEMYIQPSTIAERYAEIENARRGLFPDDATLKKYPELSVVRALTRQKASTRMRLDKVKEQIQKYFHLCIQEAVKKGDISI